MAVEEYVGNGVFTQSGGTNTTNGLVVGTGTYALNGGLLILSFLGEGSGAAFNFNGGTLRTNGGFSTTMPMTLGTSGGGASFDTAGFAVTLSGPLSGPGSLTKVDSGTLILTATNTFSGNTLISGGTLALGSSLALRDSTLDTSGGGLLSFGPLTAATLGGLTGPGALSLTNSSTAAVALSVGNNNANTTYSGALKGPGSLAKLGSGTLLLSGTNTYAGTTAVNNGILELDFLAGGAPGSNIINNASNSSALTLGGGTLTIQGNAGAANSQQFNGLTVNAGASELQGVSGSGGTASVSLGAISRYAGGTIDFTLPTSGSIATTTTTAGPGVLVDASNNGTAYASVNGGSAFATVSSGQIVALTAYSNSNSFLTATSQTLITSSTSASGTTGVVAFSNSNTILTLTGNNDIDAGGILVTPAALGTVITGGSLHAGGGNAVVIMNYGSLNVASAIVDNASGASLTVSGPGVTTLSNANTYSGTTYINNGATLQVGNGGLGASIGGTSGVTDNGDLVVNHGDAVTLSQIIRGMGGMTQTGSGLLTLTGANTYTGGTTISGGTLQIGNGTTDGSIASSSGINTNAALVYNLVGSQSYPNVISGSGGLYKTGGGTLAMTGNDTYTGGTTIIAGALQLGDGSANNGTVQGNVADSSVLVFANPLAQTYAGQISGSGSVTKTAAGMLVLAGSNSYTGGTFVNAGTFQIGCGSVSGSIAGNVADSGIVAFNRSDTVTLGSVISGAGAVVQVGPGTLVLTATNTLSGTTTISGGTLQIGNGTTDGSIASSKSIIDNATLVYNLVANQSYGYGISGSGGLYKTSIGALTLTGSNTYTGGTTINGGTLAVAGPSALPGYATPGEITTASGGMLDVETGASGWTAAGVTALLGSNGSGFALGSSLGIDTTGGSLAYAGTIGGNMGLVKLGPNALVLSAADTYSGNTLLGAGTLTLGNSLALQNSTLDTSGSGALSFGTLGSATFGGLTGPGTLSLVNSPSAAVALSVGSNNANTTYFGSLQGAGSLIKVGSGALLLGGSNTYTGSTTISGGTLNVANALALQNSTVSVLDNNSLGFSSGLSAATIGGLSGSGNVSLNNALLTVGGNNVNTAYSGALSGGSGLTKTGGGVLTLTASQSYAGPTSVQSGTLLLSGVAIATTDIGIKFTTNRSAASTYPVAGAAGRRGS